MKAVALLALLLWQAGAANDPPVAQPGTMRYKRTIRVPAGAGQACAALDAQIFPHAEPSLSDLRIFPAGSSSAEHELPYAITLSEAATEETQAARVLNLGMRDGKIAFDLEMPQRAYTGVTLELDPAVHDFLATAAVSGSDVLGGKATALGAFTLFDLTSQRLSRDTTIPLVESTFRYLHVVLGASPVAGAAAGSAARLVPAMVEGASVPPSREAQTIYTTVAETAAITTTGRKSVAAFVVPARVPVERVSFVLAAGFKGNFSRTVQVSALTEAAKKGDLELSTAGEEDAGRAPLPEVVTGRILRVHENEVGREIRTEQLGVPAILGANLQRAAKVEVEIENGDDQPLPIAAVRLEMRQRKICFNAPTSGGAELFYGDSRLSAPVYDYERLFVASNKALAAELGPEGMNAAYRAPAEKARPFAERHPEMIWIALIGVISSLGLVAIRSAKNVGRG